MRILVLSILSLSALVAAQSDAGKLWTDLAAKREALKTFHQEFDVSVVFRLSSDKTQASKHSLIVDWSQGQWREKSQAGWGSDITIFDGSEILRTEDGADEYTRSKPKGKKGETPLPSPYQVNSANWAKAVEVQRLPCGIPGSNHECVIIQVPLEPGVRGTSGQAVRMAQGNVRLMIDTVNGLLLATNTGELLENGRMSYSRETVYGLKRLSYGAPADAALFKIFDDLRQVKELSAWNAAKIKKRLAGSPAPALTAKDIHGNPVSLEALKGKIVLLDFFTTWCAPCRADAPSIDKLYQKYGSTNLAIIGLSVSEDRAIVEKFLAEHPPDYPIVLTSETDMPRAYQIGVYPTYVVIDKDGDLTYAVEGEKGFSELRGLLKKSGLDTD